MNFEKTSDLAKTNSVESLIDYVLRNKKEGKTYLFIDEVQELKDWQVAVKDLRLENISIFITGSNSTLLNDDFLNLLSGRFISFIIRPFVYREILEYCHEASIEVSEDNYLIWGGFPHRFSLPLEESHHYLLSLKDTIVVHDLIERYRINNITAFKRLVQFILVSNSRIFSSRSIYNYIKNEYPDVSLPTVNKYLEYLKQAYIISEVSRYSTKAKKELAFFGKIYNIDVGFNSIFVENNRFDLDHNLENVVYNELLYQNFKLKDYSNNGREIDFLASKDGKRYFIQVAYSVVDPKAYEREFSAFKNLDNLDKKILITCDSLDYSTSNIKHIKFKDFIRKDLESF